MKMKDNENWLSQLPAIELLVNMGYKFISPPDAYAQRQGRTSNVILEDVLREQLKKINSIQYRGGEYLFSEENIQSAIQKLKSVKYDGLLRTNAKLYDLMTLGTSLEQTIEGDSKSYTLKYIDWSNFDNNVFHVTVEYSVERSRSIKTARPDIVLFVNGLPFCVIECKAPSVDVQEAVKQSIRNQSDTYIPKLFVLSQMVIGVNKNEALYATVGTGTKFWTKWKEKALDGESGELKKLTELINKPLDDSVKQKVADSLSIYANQMTREDRLVTGQDKTLYALCRKDRLLEIALKFTVFDGGIKKIARYQQYFVVKATLERIKNFDPDGARQGGIIWHTQGSGKSLSMVMLAISLATDPDLVNPRVILVTDRTDLDGQLKDTFHACGLSPKQATSGRNLLELIKSKKHDIVTTLVHKFDKAYGLDKYKDESNNIFVLVDESHRTQFGSFSGNMRQMFPKACYLGFTGTPLTKKEKNNFVKFGDLIEPHYSIAQAVEDGAVVPLLYEGRNVEATLNKDVVDLWFEKHTSDLSEKQKADLKRKYARSETLLKADQIIYMTAFDISEHFRDYWQDSGFKAQLVAPSRAAAVKYHEYLKDVGMVASEVIMSAPDLRDGFDDAEDEEPSDEVIKFWNKMMKRYGTEEVYTSTIINGFKDSDEPEILIVVSKLLTGFDAPRNTVLYLCRSLAEHTLLQAIARVNRVFDGKDFGYIVDYASVLENLDKALTMYKSLENFDPADIQDAISSINIEVEKLPQKYDALWNVFSPIKNSDDEEVYEQFLADEEIREEFYHRLREYKKTLTIAQSSDKFLFDTDDRLLRTYKSDFKKFDKLMSSVKLRYAEVVDFKDHAAKIEKMVNQNIQATGVTQLNTPTCIIENNDSGTNEEVSGYEPGEKTTASQADSIAHVAKRISSENLTQDKEFYRNLSTLIQQAIDDFRAKRISDLAYLEKSKDYYNKAVHKIHDDVPESIKGQEAAMAYFGDVKNVFKELEIDDELKECIAGDTALAIDKIVKSSHKVDFWNDPDAKNDLVDAIEDYLYDQIKNEDNSVELSLEQMDRIIAATLATAKARSRV
jgi:type I restriction enzyme R subunit